MSKKQLFSKVESFFSTFEEAEPPKPLDNLRRLNSWNWECDLNGTYISCGAEVREYLGIPAEDFIGSSIFSFRIHPESSHALRLIFEQSEPSAEITLLLQAADGKFIHVKSHIFPRPAENGRIVALNGINQIPTIFDEPLQFSPGPGNPIINNVPQIDRSNAILINNVNQQAEKTVPLRRKTSKETDMDLSEVSKINLASISKTIQELAPSIESEIKPTIQNQEQTQPITTKFIPAFNELIQEEQSTDRKTVALISPSEQPVNATNIQGAPTDTISNPIMPTFEELVYPESNLTQESTEISTPEMLVQTPELPISTTPTHPIPLNFSNVHEQEHQILIQSSDREHPGTIRIPFNFGTQGKGYLELLTGEEQTNWSSDDEFIVKEVANQLYAALENTQLDAIFQQELSERIRIEQEIWQRNRDLSTLNQIGQQISRLATREDIFDLLYSMIGQLMDNPNMLVALLDADQQAFYYPIFSVEGNRTQVPPTPLNNSMAAYIIRTKKPLLVNDQVEVTLFEKGIDIPDRIPASIIAIPMLNGDNAIGVIILQNFDQIYAYNEIQVELLSTISSQVTTALENASLFQEIQRRALELEVAAQIARDTSSTLSLDLLLSKIVNSLCEYFSFYHASIYMLDETQKQAVIREAAGAEAEFLKQSKHSFMLDDNSIVGSVLMNGKSIIVNDISLAQGFSKTSLLPETRSEICIPLKSGNQIIGVVDVHSTHEHAFSKDEPGVLQILSDQTSVAIENARAYELSQKAIIEMKELDRLKSQFLANMSHELRTPLNSIIGFSRVILKGIDGPVTDLQQQDLTSIYSSGQHLLNLINDILDLSKIEARKMQLAVSEINILDIVDSAITTVSGLLKDKPVEIVKKYSSDLPQILADPTRIRQVLLNLLSNAAKFTDDGNIIVEVKTQSEDETKPELIVIVSDTGPGIAVEDQAKLFQPFTQVEEWTNRKPGGTGLGLSISKSLIEMHQGRIGIAWSEIGKGSAFYFTLPIPEVPIIVPSKTNTKQSN